MVNHPPLFFNQNVILPTSPQKHIGMFLDSKLNFSESLKITKKTIELLRKLQTLLPKAALIKMFKFFIRPHLGYGDMIHDQTLNMSFLQKNGNNLV